MSKVDELLSGLSGDEIAAYTLRPDTEPHIVINEDRSITVPNELKNIAVQFDNGIETVTFDCPRYWDGHDLSEMRMYVNYERSDKKNGGYLVENLRVDDEDETIIHFDWTLKRDVTGAKGKLSILVCAQEVDHEGIEIIHWNSQINQEFNVLEGLDCENAVVEEYPAIIASLLNRMDAVEDLPPTVDVELLDDGGYRVTCTSLNGTRTFTVYNGEKGATGATGATGPTGPKGDDVINLLTSKKVKMAIGSTSAWNEYVEKGGDTKDVLFIPTDDATIIDIQTAIDNIVNGTTTVAKATTATNATSADKADKDGDGNVIKDTYATQTTVNNIVNGTTTVAKATTATNADKATKDGHGDVIANTYATKEEVSRVIGIDKADGSVMFIRPNAVRNTLKCAIKKSSIGKTYTNGYKEITVRTTEPISHDDNDWNVLKVSDTFYYIEEVDQSNSDYTKYKVQCRPDSILDVLEINLESPATLMTHDPVQLAIHADIAIHDGDGNIIADTYATKEEYLSKDDASNTYATKSTVCTLDDNKLACVVSKPGLYVCNVRKKGSASANHEQWSIMISIPDLDINNCFAYIPADTGTSWYVGVMYDGHSSTDQTLSVTTTGDNSTSIQFTEVRLVTEY